MADVPTGSTSPNSNLKVDSTPRDHQKVATQGPDQQITVQTTIPSNFLVEAASRAGVPEDRAGDRTADFYRDGDPRREALSRFVEPFDDEQASIRIVANPDSQNPEDIIPRYTKFILQGVQEGHQERSQIVETFGDFYSFFYGERPPMYAFSGTLINTRNANWVSDFMVTYESFLRGTRCAEQSAQAIVTYGGRQAQGFILSTNMNTQAVNQEGVNFSFQMVVTKRRFLGFSDDAGLVTSDGRSAARGDTIAAIINAIAGPSGKGLSGSQTSEAWGNVNRVMTQNAPPSQISDLGTVQV